MEIFILRKNNTFLFFVKTLVEERLYQFEQKQQGRDNKSVITTV